MTVPTSAADRGTTGPAPGRRPDRGRVPRMGGGDRDRAPATAVPPRQGGLRLPHRPGDGGVLRLGGPHPVPPRQAVGPGRASARARVRPRLLRRRLCGVRRPREPGRLRGPQSHPGRGRRCDSRRGCRDLVRKPPPSPTRARFRRPLRWPDRGNGGGPTARQRGGPGFHDAGVHRRRTGSPGGLRAGAGRGARTAARVPGGFGTQATDLPPARDQQDRSGRDGGHGLDRRADRYLRGVLGTAHELAGGDVVADRAVLDPVGDPVRRRVRAGRQVGRSSRPTMAHRPRPAGVRRVRRELPLRADGLAAARARCRRGPCGGRLLPGAAVASG